MNNASLYINKDEYVMLIFSISRMWFLFSVQATELSTDHTEGEIGVTYSNRGYIHRVTIRLCFTYYIGQWNYILKVYGYITHKYVYGYMWLMNLLIILANNLFKT